MDVLDHINAARADGVNFKVKDGKLGIVTTEETEHWLDELAPLTQEILEELGGVPPKLHKDNSNGKPRRPKTKTKDRREAG